MWVVVCILIFFAGNQIADLTEVQYLRGCTNLRVLHFQQPHHRHANPICEMYGYKPLVLSTCQQKLLVLDHAKVHVEVLVKLVFLLVTSYVVGLQWKSLLRFWNFIVLEWCYWWIDELIFIAYCFKRVENWFLILTMCFKSPLCVVWYFL